MGVVTQLHKNGEIVFIVCIKPSLLAAELMAEKESSEKKGSPIEHHDKKEQPETRKSSKQPNREKSRGVRTRMNPQYDNRQGCYTYYYGDYNYNYGGYNYNYGGYNDEGYSHYYDHHSSWRGTDSNPPPPSTRSESQYRKKWSHDNHRGDRKPVSNRQPVSDGGKDLPRDLQTKKPKGTLSNNDIPVKPIPLKKTTPRHQTSSSHQTGPQKSTVIVHQVRTNNTKTKTTKESTRKREGKTFVAPTVQGNVLAQELTAGTYECMVCCEKVRNRQEIWGCPCCYNLFHLKCIGRWARSPAASVNEGMFIIYIHMYMQLLKMLLLLWKPLCLDSSKLF